MPLLPGFEGNIADPASTVLRIQVHHQYQAICRGPNSLFQVLNSKHSIDAKEYVHFFGLRTCELIGSIKAT
jgi:phospholipase D1/2